MVSARPRHVNADQTCGSTQEVPSTPAQPAVCGSLPIIVDLDKTLILTDSLYEQIAAVCVSEPVGLLKALPHLVEGRAALKAALAQQVDPDAVTWPLCDDLVLWLRNEADKGREIHLCSGANQVIADSVARHLGFFTTATGSDRINLKGQAKADYLATRFPEGFVYVGDSRADLPVWRAAQGIILANTSAAVERAARDLGRPVIAQFQRPLFTIIDCLAALRVHHWTKNALIFVPFILGHAWAKPHALATVVMGLFCLLMITSATYLINDISDLSADRRHWSKRNRALASGRLSIPAGFSLAALLLMGGFGGALALSPSFALILAGYVVLTFAYSMGLKRVPLLDTFIIGTLFTSRLVMGIALLNLDYSEWLLTFSMFFFFSLAIAKRHTEIVRAGRSLSHGLVRRGYQLEDAPLTLVLGVSTSVASLLIMVLFIVQEVQQQGLYSHPKTLWAIPMALSLWVSRIWLFAHRGQLDDDPVSFAVRDKVSLLLGAGLAVIFVVSL
jgi:4-hydroxybenzoate polyprenyltransferase/phosphoserine phosphatase